MRRRSVPLIAVLVTVLLLAGSCRRSQPVDPIEKVVVSGDDASVSELRWDSANKLLTFRVGSNQVGAVGASRMDGLPAGTSMELRDEDGTLCFGVAVGSNDAGDVSWVRERTESNELLMTRRVTESMVREEYWADGDHLVVTYPNLGDEVVARAVAHYLAGRESELDEVPQLVDAFRRFEAFYNRHRSNSLHNNADGDRLAAIATSEDFLEASSEVIDDGSGSPKRFWAYTCTGAAICAYFKCHFGGPFNSVCDLCAAVSILCLLTPFIVP
jgi:hypothetical protein